MKQLKFMLAAATAISLATAAQAELVESEISSENFDAVTTLEDTAALMALPGFSYEGATATDNESYVVAGGANGTDNALNVNTGTDPLLRKINPAGAATGEPLDSTGAKKMYIDTMVQFTVTPDGDTVCSNGVNDKLMIYLKETKTSTTTGEGEDAVTTTTCTTNLMVKAAKYQPGDEWEGTLESFAETDVIVSAADLTVTTNTWYHLEVVASVSNGVPVFSISIDDKQLTTDVSLYFNDGTKFPSLMGKSSTALNQVGFAGEGMVDELVFSQDVEQQTSVDFTFTLAWDAAGFSSVTYTIDDGEPVTPENGGSFTVPDTKKLVIAYELNDWYKISGSPVLEYTAAVNETDSLTLVAEKAANVVDGKVEVTESTKPADVGIKTGSFAADTTPVAELNKVLTWATAKAGKSASEAGGFIGNLDFSDDTETTTEQAYLLNCDPEKLDEAKAAFKFPEFTPGQLPVADENNFNGRVILKGATALGAWFDVVNDTAAENYGKILVEGAPVVPSFFKAVLVK